MEWFKSAMIPGTREYMLTTILVGVLCIIIGIIIPSGFIHNLFLVIFYVAFAAAAYPFVKAIVNEIKEKLKK